MGRPRREDFKGCFSTHPTSDMLPEIIVVFFHEREIASKRLIIVLKQMRTVYLIVFRLFFNKD